MLSTGLRARSPLLGPTVRGTLGGVSPHSQPPVGTSVRGEAKCCQVAFQMPCVYPGAGSSQEPSTSDTVITPVRRRGNRGPGLVSGEVRGSECDTGPHGHMGARTQPGSGRRARSASSEPCPLPMATSRKSFKLCASSSSSVRGAVALQSMLWLRTVPQVSAWHQPAWCAVTDQFPSVVVTASYNTKYAATSCAGMASTNVGLPLKTV